MFTRRNFVGLIGGAGAAGMMGNMGAPFIGRAFAQDRRTITVAVDNLKETLAPVNGLSLATTRFFLNMYSRLIERDFLADPNGLKLLPSLATSWEQNGAVWKFQLREGVKFHDGTEFTAEDAAFTFSAERFWGEKAFEPRGKTFTSNFVRVEATGKYTFEIETDTPDPNIPGKLTGFAGHIVPKKYYLDMGVEKFGQMPIGTGAYRVTEFRSGDVLVMEAFDEFWGGKPPVQKIVWKIVPEFAARMAGLVSGEFDFIVNIPTDQQAMLRTYPEVSLRTLMTSTYPMIAFNTVPDPVDNPLVDEKLRYAMVQGVDMNLIVKTLWGDATFHPTAPFNFPEYGDYYDPNMTNPLAYDPDKARAWVKQTGYNGQTLIWHILQGFYPNYEVAADIMVDQWREIGINVQAEPMSNLTLYNRPFHLLSQAHASSFIPGDPYQPLWLDWSAKSNFAISKWKIWEPSARFTELGEAFEKTTSFEERKKAYLELSAEWQRLTPGMYMWKNVNAFASRKDYEWTPVGEGEMRMFGDFFKIV